LEIDLYLDKLNKHHITRNLVHRLERLGYAVTIEGTAAAITPGAINSPAFSPGSPWKAIRGEYSHDLQSQRTIRPSDTPMYQLSLTFSEKVLVLAIAR
jgi:hypothetical protein